MPAVPDSLSLETIEDASEAIASELRNNFTDISAFAAAVVAILNGGSAGEFLARVGSEVDWAGAYTAHTLVLTAGGGSPAVGNGTAVARYLQIGKLVHYYGSLTFGSTTSFGTGDVEFSLPVTSNSALLTGFARLIDASTAGQWWGQALPAAGIFKPHFMAAVNAATGQVTIGFATATAPFTFETGDSVEWNFVYEAA